MMDDDGGMDLKPGRGSAIKSTIVGESIYLLVLLLHKLEGEAGFCRLLPFDMIKGTGELH